MDPIAASLINVRSIDLANQVSVAVAKKSMDAVKQQGAAALELLKAAADVAKQQSSGSYSASDRIDILA